MLGHELPAVETVRSAWYPFAVSTFLVLAQLSVQWIQKWRHEGITFKRLCWKAFLYSAAIFPIFYAAHVILWHL